MKQIAGQTAGPTTDAAAPARGRGRPSVQGSDDRTGLRGEFEEIGRRWSVSMVRLVGAAVELEQSGEWVLDGARTCAHWIADVVDVEVCTAREWLRTGRAIRELPSIRAAFEGGELSFTKTRTLTRIANPANEAELCELAQQTPAGMLSTALAAWSERNEDPDERHRRQREDRALRWSTQPDGMVRAVAYMTPEQAATFVATIDAAVKRRDGREFLADQASGDTAENAESEGDATGSRGSHAVWLSMAQQRIDALVDLVRNGGASVSTDVILHIRADGCTLDDGTPIGNSFVERIASTSYLRAMIHDAESNPINVSGRHRRHTDRQKLVVKERDRVCVDCGSDEFLEFDHDPDFEVSKRTLVDETALRCGPCHRARHGRQSQARVERERGETSEHRGGGRSERGEPAGSGADTDEPGDRKQPDDGAS